MQTYWRTGVRCVVQCIIVSAVASTVGRRARGLSGRRGQFRSTGIFDVLWLHSGCRWSYRPFLPPHVHRLKVYVGQSPVPSQTVHSHRSAGSPNQALKLTELAGYFLMPTHENKSFRATRAASYHWKVSVGSLAPVR